MNIAAQIIEIIKEFEIVISLAILYWIMLVIIKYRWKNLDWNSSLTLRSNGFAVLAILLILL